MATTRLILRAAIIAKLYSPRRPTSSAADSGGSTSTILDSVLAPAAQSEDFLRAWIYVTTLQGSGPAVGSIARVTNVDFSGSTSTLTVAPVFTSATEDGMEYEIHYVFHPDDVNDAIDDVIRDGTRGALGALATDSATTVFERDVLVNGVLAMLKRRMASLVGEEDFSRVTFEADTHEQNYIDGLIRSGYPPLQATRVNRQVQE